MCWKYLPFGLNVVQDIFQAKMDQILEGLDNVVSITDDVAVYGQNKEDQEKNLLNLMVRAAEIGIVYNSKKCFIKQTSISFNGNIFTTTEIKSDPAKVYNIKKIPTPQNKGERQCFLGVFNYHSQYIPELAEKAHLLCGLLKSQSPWVWDPDH